MPLELVEISDARWDAAVDEVRGDLFYRREFCRFRLEGQQHRPVLLRYEDELGVVVDVTTVREVARLPFYATVSPAPGSPPIDVASPEYNGPVVLARGDDAELVRRQRAAVEARWRELGVVTEFVRLHPFAPASLPDTVQVGDVIYVDLRRGYDAAAAGYEDGHRRTARRAAREGSRHQIVPADAEHVARLSALYDQTMARAGAKAVYRHAPAYFEALFRNLGARTLLVESYAPDGAVASSICFFLGERHVWYMYGGTVEEQRKSGANTLLFDRMIAWAAEHGYHYLILGGGFTPGDGLYRNKRGYSHLTAPVRHLRKVHDPQMLARLEEAKAAWDRAQGREPRTDYFPSYWL